MLCGSCESVSPNPPSLHLVSRHEGQHTCARVKGVVACIMGVEPNAWVVDKISVVLCMVWSEGAAVVAPARSQATDSEGAMLLPIQETGHQVM